MGKILALDVGGTRIGVAAADAQLRFANPLTTLTNDEAIWDRLAALLQEHDVQTVVVGLPRGLEGQETAQTSICRDFAKELRERLQIAVALQDEATTSLKAEAELKARGKPYEKSDIDALAATYILEDYLHEETV
ncbi:MAG TPA: Holliday junction resolvase RuvX [Candidatus Microsaccharimonas sp.]|nr:Holliday junction resolvase RuvX [Candidatus Microsaccharimonas sp.]